MIKNNFRILKKTHANLQTIAKAPVKFQKDWPKTVGGFEGTRYLLKIRNQAPRTTESRKQCPSAFLRKSGGQKSEILRLFEPPHDKTNKMACAPSEDSDQPGHPPSLIRVFAVCMKKAWVLSYPLSAQRRLIRLEGCPGWSESSLGGQSFCLLCHEVAHLASVDEQASLSLTWSLIFETGFLVTWFNLPDRIRGWRAQCLGWHSLFTYSSTTLIQNTLPPCKNRK